MLVDRSLDLDSGPLLRVDVQRGGTHGSVPRVVVAGELDDTTVTSLHRAVVELLRHDVPGRVDVDLADVTFLDTCGIRTLLACLVDARQVGCELRLTDPQPLVYRVLRIVGLLDLFSLAHDAPTPPAQRGWANAATEPAGGRRT
jgi:anti-anti-sigma factor